MGAALTAITNARVIPLVQSEDPYVAVETARALAEGGLTSIEVVLRTEAALACMEAILSALPELSIGAGTVLNKQQAEDVARRGAKFIVSPGLDEGVVACAKKHGLDVFPGVATAGEAQRAVNLGLKTVKFFPAALSGGPQMIKALASVFRDLEFMPTGGVSASNLADYLVLPSVIACGGSWLTPKKEIGAGNFEAIKRLAEEALAIVRAVSR